MALKAEDEFNSYSELECKIKLFENTSFVKLWKRDAKTIEEKKVTKILQVKKDIPEEFWPCYDCKSQLCDDSDAIQCSHCLEWYHLKCTPKKKSPKSPTWFCPECRETA